MADLGKPRSAFPFIFAILLWRMDMYTDDDLSDLVNENLRLTRENNKLLRKMHRAQVWATIFKVLWLAVLIGVPIWFYLSYVEPYMQQVMTTYNEMQAQVDGLKEIESKLPSKDDLPGWAQGFFGSDTDVENSTSTSQVN